jgi:hypothetical protein
MLVLVWVFISNLFRCEQDLGYYLDEYNPSLCDFKSLLAI